MSRKTDSEVVQETLQRVIRTETRLMTLGAKLGFDLKDDEYIDVHIDPPAVVLQSLDVAYTSVIRACRRAGLHGAKREGVLQRRDGGGDAGMKRTMEDRGPTAPINRPGALRPDRSAINFLLWYFGYPIEVPSIDPNRGTTYWKLSGKPTTNQENDDGGLYEETDAGT